MKDLIKKLTVDRNYVFLGERKDLVSVLQEAKVIKFKLIDHTEIRFYPDISWGTMVGGLPGLNVEGINVRAKTSPLGTDRLKINISTKVRPEHYFMIGLFIFFFIGAAFSNKPEPWWTFLYIFGLWIICHSWFQFIYRAQENYLIEKLVKELRLVKL